MSLDLQDILGMLDHVSGPTASGDYQACCTAPGHRDRNPSMTVNVKESPRDGKRRIVFCCQKGCNIDQILAGLPGVTKRDLILDPDPDWKKRHAGKRRENRTPGPAVDPETGEILPETGEKVENIGGVTVHTTAKNGQNGGAADGTAGGSDGAGFHGGDVGGGDRGNGGDHGGDHGGPAGGSVGEAKEPEEPEKPKVKIDWNNPVKIYSYTDAEGTELFQVVRYREIDEAGNTVGKTFRQRMRPTAEQRAQAKEGKLKITRDGYVNTVNPEIRDRTLYRMPKVAAAIRDGRPVYVVEGEKDVETMERLGHTATCNPGGASKDKWRPGHTEALKGADVIILPDCDTAENKYTGQEHAYAVALALTGVAKRVRLVDLKECCPEIPPKGDISDMVAMLGDVEAMDALARQVAATRTFDAQTVPFWLSPAEQVERLYEAVRGYGAENGCIVQKTTDGSKALCDFTVIPRMELIQDDGVSQKMQIVMDGWDSAGHKLKRAAVTADEFDNMNWVTKTWGMNACIAPGSTTKGKVAWAIKKVGQKTAQRVTEYSHTGWRKIGGRWCYLYHGGAIGMEGVSVNLGDNTLKTYRLDGSGAEGFDEIPWKDAAAVSRQIQTVMKEEIGVALLGTMYLAPLREFLQATDVVPAFALFLYGKTGTHKTTAASLALAHFGNFHAKNPPASFHSTGNQIRAQAFLCKDMPLLVDDYHPTTSMQEKRQMAGIAQTLSRAFGDGSDRGRLNADRTIAASKPPRSVAVITGEDLPAIGASGLARFFILDIDEQDIPTGKELTEMQEKARAGYLQRAMRGYIVWLSKQTDRLPDQLHDLFIKIRDQVQKQSEGQHDRAPEAIACILIGYMMMCRYFEAVKLIDAGEGTRMTAHAMRVLMDAARAQAKSMESEKPTRIFLDMMGQLLSSKTVMLKDLSAEKVRDPFPNEHMVGYMDQDYYYLLPDLAFSAVSKLCREQGVEFPVSPKALMKHLRTDGVLKGLGSDSDSATRAKRIDGKLKRVLWIPQEEMDGPKPEAAQVTVADAMTEVGNDVLPEEFRNS